ncbi:Uncharacterized membrane protein [Sporobacter termitidis DSM 10068]|uniref:Uncharacterized membrane protein n=1 Tax=Sporobacter termitidis DSM 10068 TaxID=1123282 RepID=A0A1M5VAV8_9FIRM|nr:heparan-alpha-glucosaminide N-acetyltransferase [Sporobacter termitidis]SHH72355.1 Uncharacterized membrane protein [Sporobacter termitidis DSM 10068]
MTPVEQTPARKRIDIIDALRGLSVILMVFDHLMYDLVVFMGAPSWFFSNPVFNFLHYVFAGLFIFLSGVSSQFSRSNVKRGIKVFAIAIGFTIVTSLPFIDEPIRFGVLHLLGFCMIFYGLTRRAWDAIPRIVAPVVYIVLLVGTALATGYIKIDASFLWMLGWYQWGFFSADYFPIFPWLFVFLLGTWAGVYVAERKLPEWFYEKKIAFLPAVGKKSLLIYVLHQPVLYGVIMGILYLKG